MLKKTAYTLEQLENKDVMFLKRLTFINFFLLKIYWVMGSILSHIETCYFQDFTVRSHFL